MAELSITVALGTGPFRRIALGGWLDEQTHGQLDEALAPLLEDAGLQVLELDLGQLEYVSSAGLRSFVRARRALSGRGGRLLLWRPQPFVQRILELVQVVSAQDLRLDGGD